MANTIASKFLTGQTVGISKHSQQRPASLDDRELFMRLSGQSADDFNRNLSNKLRYVADLATIRAAEALEQGQFKPGELGFILSVAEDKRARLDGNSLIHSATVNVQINNINGAGSGQTKDQLLEMLQGLSRSGTGNGVGTGSVSFPSTGQKQPDLPAIDLPAAVPLQIESPAPAPGAQLPSQQPSIP